MMTRLAGGLAMAITAGAALAQEDCDIHDASTIRACLADYSAAEGQVFAARRNAPDFAREAIAACSDRMMPDLPAVARCAVAEAAAAEAIARVIEDWRGQGAAANVFVQQLLDLCTTPEPTTMEALATCLDGAEMRQRVIVNMMGMTLPDDPGYVEPGTWTLAGDASRLDLTLAGEPAQGCSGAQPIITVTCTPDGLQVRLQTTCSLGNDDGMFVTLLDRFGIQGRFRFLTVVGGDATETRNATARAFAQQLIAMVDQGEMRIRFDGSLGTDRELLFPRAAAPDYPDSADGFCGLDD